jgi:hypothetical protein
MPNGTLTHYVTEINPDANRVALVSPICVIVHDKR